MREPLVRLLDALEAIAADHEEVYDTDVRERMASFIERRFVASRTDVDVPAEFGMCANAT